MKKTAAGCQILCLIITMLLLVVPVSASITTDINLSVSRGYNTIDGQLPMLDLPEDLTNFKSALLYDYTNDKLICAANPDQRCEPASLVKIMTALIIAQNGNMEDLVTVDATLLEALPSDSLGAELQDGEVLSMQDLLYCILVESANDASVVAADHIFGSVDEFVLAMNRYAKELGCTNTNFTNVHGIFDEQQVISARDAARILAEAVKNDVFMQAFTTIRYTVPATNKSDERKLSSSNAMMNDDWENKYIDRRVTGGRTGVTEASERNLAITADRNDVKLICIVLGSASEFDKEDYSLVRLGSYDEASALLDLGFMEHRSVQLFHTGQVLQQCEVKNGDSHLTIGVKDAVPVLIPFGVSSDELSYRYDEGITSIQAPVESGTQISTVEVWYKDLCLVQEELYALHDVKVREITQTDAPTEDVGSGFPKFLLIAAIIIVILVLLLIGRRYIFRLIRTHRIRHHKKNRRRSR